MRDVTADDEDDGLIVMREGGRAAAAAGLRDGGVDDVDVRRDVELGRLRGVVD